MEPPIVARQEVLLAGEGNRDHVQDRKEIHYGLAVRQAHFEESIDDSFDVSPVAELALDAVLTKDDTLDGHLHNAGVFVVVDLSLASLIWGY